MNVVISLAAVLGLFVVGWVGASAGLGMVFGVVLPYLAATIFLAGIAYRVMSWAGIPVPFRIPTTCGQQKSLSWIKRNRIDNPHTTLEVVARMTLEVLFFRSLLRNTRSQLIEGKRLVYGTELSLWLAAMAMHWSLLIILVRHLRLMTNPVPAFVTFVSAADGFFEIGLPVVFTTSILFLAGVTFLLVRRLAAPNLRYISLAADYFPLFLLLGIGLSGVAMRHLAKTDITGIKELALGLTRFSPVVPDGISPLFFGHLFLVCVLLAYFPASKLVHMAAMFMSPTRNLANNNRAVRHVNPWDYPVKVHTYEEYEDELRDKMKTAGIAVERE